MEAMDYTSKAPIQSLLDALEKKKYIARTGRSARSIQILKPSTQIPILGVIAAGGLVEVFSDETDWGVVDLSSMDYFKRLSRYERSQHFALRVQGDSMIGALIGHGDVVVLRRESNPQTLKDRTIVAARVDSTMTLKYLYRPAKHLILLKPANPAYPEIEVDAAAVSIEGVYIGRIGGFV